MSASDRVPALRPGTRLPVRLFPLPNLVLFPHVMQPLHIFEQRYCELLQDAMDGDGLITMAVLEPGWESDYERSPPVARTVCVGQVTTCARDESDGYSILLLGLRRAAIVSERTWPGSYRRAEVELLADRQPETGAPERSELQQTLIDLFRRCLPKTAVAQEPFQLLLASQISLGVLTDIMAFTLQLDIRDKLALLAQLDAVERARQLVAILQQWPRLSASGPPHFHGPPSVN